MSVEERSSRPPPKPRARRLPGAAKSPPPQHDLDELEDLITRYRPKLIYTNPTFQNPTGWTMPLKLRRQLLTLASRLRVPIIEDDTYRELFLTTPPPQSLQALDTQSVVIHLNPFSKAL